VMFAVPSLLVSVVAAALTTAAFAGALWLFVLGDDPWPSASGVALGVVAVVVGVGLCFGLLSAAYATGKKEEGRASLNRQHVLLAVGVTVVLGALIAGRTMGVGVTGTRSDSQICADLCLAEGFAGSGMPPQDSGDRTCTCYGNDGREAMEVALP